MNTVYDDAVDDGLETLEIISQVLAISPTPYEKAVEELSPADAYMPLFQDTLADTQIEEEDSPDQ
eukprot:5474545-Karenia_brevis.AAC.1